MPRPAAKRNRKPAPVVPAKKTVDDSANNANNGVSDQNSSAEQSTRIATGARAGSATRGCTPISKVSEQVFESSPLKEPSATGSRPQTRSRGYSSTLFIAGRRGDGSSRIPGTPGFESSILSNFRRRPRQQSILHMMQADDGSSGEDDQDFLGGLSPEDESTPFNLLRRKKSVIPSLAPSPFQPSLPLSASSRKRKHSVEVQVPQSSLNFVKGTPGGSPLIEISGKEAENLNDLPQSHDSPEPEIVSQILASPKSSSRPSSPTRTSPTSTLEESVRLENMKKGEKVQGGEEMPRPPKAQSHLSTATLRERLLPRRRPRRQQRNSRDGQDFDLSSEGSDEEHGAVAQDHDELSYLPNKPRSRQNRTQKERSGASTKLKAVMQDREKKRLPRKQVAVMVRATYGSRSSRDHEPDKENRPIGRSSPLSTALNSDELLSDNFERVPQRRRCFMSEELSLQVKKFAEIDRWEMEFEDVDISPSQESTAR